MATWLRYLVINLLFFLITIKLTAQETKIDNPPTKLKILVGLDLTQNIYMHSDDRNGIVIEPIVKLITGKYKPVVALAVGYSKYRVDRIMANLDNYINEGYYLKLGIETRLKTLKKVKFNGGLNFVLFKYNETGNIVFSNNYFEDGNIKFERKNKAGLGLELTGNLHIPVSQKIILCLQPKIGLPKVNYEDVPYRGSKMKPVYVQGMGYTIDDITVGLNLQIFYILK